MRQTNRRLFSFMYIIMTEDQKCVVKGKSRKYICGVNEKTRKELVTYETEQRAKAAIMRMMPIPSSFVSTEYDDCKIYKLVPVEINDKNS